MDNSLQNRIWLTRYLMVIGIVVLHTPPYQPLSELGLNTFDFIKAFFSHALFRMTVPMLTVISAYLLFSSSLILHPARLISKKVTSILIPLILWNIPLVIAIYILQRYELVSHIFSVKLYPANAINWLNASTGMFGTPANYPLNFLRDLFVLSILAPLFLIFLRVIPYWGLIIVLVVYYFNLEGDLILRNSMLVSFYIGALAAWKKWDICAMDKFAWPLLILLVATCCAVVIWDVENREWLRMITPFIIWPCMALVSNSFIGRMILPYTQNSFLTFLAHAPLLILLWFVYKPFSNTIPYPVFWLSAPLVIVVICAFIQPLMYKLMPKLTKILLGGR